jgi:hypothetical protein
VKLLGKSECCSQKKRNVTYTIIHFLKLYLLNRLSVYLTEIYQRPYCRIGPYLFGLFAGYLLYRNSQNELRVGNWTLLAGHILCVFGFIYPLMFNYAVDWSAPIHAIYLGTSNLCWSAAVCWLVFCCVSGRIPIMNRFLCCPSFRPMARLTYTTYLLHLIIYSMYLFSLPNGISSPGTVGFLITFFGLYALTLILSLPFVLLIEMPSIAIGKLLLIRQ